MKEFSCLVRVEAITASANKTIVSEIAAATMAQSQSLSVISVPRLVYFIVDRGFVFVNPYLKLFFSELIIVL